MEANSLKYFSCTLLFFIALYSCNTKGKGSGDEPNQGQKSASFEKLDSIKIHYLGNLTVNDIDPVNGIVLFMEYGESSEEIILTDFEGNIINSFSKIGDMPDTYGRLMASVKLLDNDSILVYGYNGFMTYDFDGDLLSRIKLVDFEVPSRVRLGIGYGMEKKGDRYLYINQGYPPNGDYSDISFYESIYLLNWLYPATGEKKSFIQFPKSSIFRSGKYFFRGAWDPVYALADSRIYVAFGLEPVIYTFEDSPPYSLISSVPLNLPEYRYFKGHDNYTVDLENFSHRFISGFIENIKKVGPYFLVVYFPGYDAADSETRLSRKSQEETANFNAMVQKKYQNRIAILDSLGDVVADFVPEGLDAKSLILRNGELWMQETPDKKVEQDFFRLFRVGLKVE